MMLRLWIFFSSSDTKNLIVIVGKMKSDDFMDSFDENMMHDVHEITGYEN